DIRSEEDGTPCRHPGSQLVNAGFHKLLALRRPLISELVSPQLEGRYNGNTFLLHLSESGVIQLAGIGDAVRQDVRPSAHSGHQSFASVWMGEHGFTSGVSLMCCGVNRALREQDGRPT